MFQYQKARRNHNSKLFEGLAKFKNFETTLSNTRNRTNEEIEGQFNSGNAWYCAVSSISFPSAVH
jgi:hypothetical protein